MNIKLHNRIEINNGGVIKTYYNTLLPNLNDGFIEGKDYTRYIAMGCGNHHNLNGVTALSVLECVEEAEICAYNFDISKGTIFLSRMIEIKEMYNGALFTEAAFTPNADGSGIINHVSLDYVAKQTGRKLTVTATLYLEFDGILNGGHICNGENPLFKVLFGLENFSALNVRAVCSDGVIAGGKRGTVKILSYNNGSCTPQSESVKISAAIPAQSDYREVLLMCNNAPCISYCADNFEATEFTQFVDINIKQNEAIYEGAGVKEMLSLKKGTQYYGNYSYRNIPQSVCGEYKNIFENIITPNDRIFQSVCGNYFACYSGDTLRVYDIGAGLVPINFLYMNFDIKCVEDVLIDSGGNVFVRQSKNPRITVYKNDNRVLKHCTVTTEFPQNITCWKLSMQQSVRYIYYVYNSGGKSKFECRTASINGLVYSESIYSGEEGNILRLFNDRKNTEYIICDSVAKTVQKYNIPCNIPPNVADLLFDCDDAHINNRMIYICCGGKWRVFDLLYGTEKNVYAGGVRSVKMSSGGNIVRLHSDNTISGLYSDYSTANLYAYNARTAIKDKITAVYALDRCIILCAQTRFCNCYFLPLNFDKLLINTISVTGWCQAEIKRRSFNNFGGKQLSAQLRIV